MDLLDRLRDLIVLAAVPGAGASGLLDASEDQIERMRKQAAEFGSDRLAMAAETISNGLVEMRGATSPRLLLELMCAQVLLPASAAPDRTASETEVGDLAARIERLERQLAAAGGAGRDDRARPPAGREARTQAQPPGRPAAEPARTRAPTSSAPSPAPAARGVQAPQAAGGGAAGGAAAGGAAAGALNADELRNRWPDVLEAVRDVRKTAWILLSNYASIDTVEGNVLTMAFDSEGNAKGFASSGSDGYLAAVIDRMFGVRPVIRAIVNPAAAGGAGRSAVRQQDEQVGSGGARHRPAPGGAAGRGADHRGADHRGADHRGGDHGDRASAPGSDRRAAPGDGGDAAATSGRAAAGAGPGRQPGSDDAGGRARGETQPARTARPARGGGRSSATAQPRRPPGPDHSDDPRPFTDTAPGDGGDALTGSDLVMRELGGKVIDDT
jgi:DNA polymerase-3 subunit gamma/tau